MPRKVVGTQKYVLRSLHNLYSKSKMRVRWNGEISNVFTITVKCGVKGGGASPTLFNIYFNELYKLLIQSGYCCHICNNYMKVLDYADDLSILSPSRKAVSSWFQQCRWTLTYIYEQFAIEYHIRINKKKLSYYFTMLNVYIILL